MTTSSRTSRRVSVAAAGLIATATLAAATSDGGHQLVSGESWRPKQVVEAGGVNGAVLLTGQISGATIGPARITGAYRAVESRPDAMLRSIAIKGLTASELERDGIRLRGDVRDITITNFALTMRSARQKGSHLPEGIALMSGRNISISDGSVAGFRMERIEGKYTNGDGIAAEGAVRGLRILRVEASDNSDAGFDLKSKDTHLDALTARRNGRNYRFWGQIRAGTLTSIDPRGAHIWAGKGAIIRIERLVARSSTTAAVLSLESPQKVVIGRCELSVPAGTKLVKGTRAQARIELGPGCSVPGARSPRR